MNDESTPSGLAPELEARIIAFLLGEASDFERDELERLMEERADVRHFRDQMRFVYGLLEHAAGDVPVETQSDENVTEEIESEWKLSDEKRSTVLALFADQEGAEIVSATEADDGSLTEHAARVRVSSDDASHKSVVAEAPGSQNAIEMIQRKAVRLLLEYRVWVTAASLLLLFGCVSVWLSYGLQDFGAVSRVVSDTAVTPEAPTAAAPMTAMPSDSASGGVNAWFGRSGSASKARVEATQGNEKADLELSENESLGEDLGADFDADMDGAMSMQADMSGSKMGMASERESRRISDQKQTFGGEDASRLSGNGRFEQSEEQEEEFEPDASPSSMPTSGLTNPTSQSVATRAATVVPDSRLYYRGTESLNRVSPNLGEAGQAEQPNQPAFQDQSIVDGVANGAFHSGRNQMGRGADGGGVVGGLGGDLGGAMGGGAFGGMGGGGMGGGGGFGGTGSGMGGMGDGDMEGIVARSGKSSGLSARERADLEDLFGDKLQQQGQQQATELLLEKSLSGPEGDRAVAESDPFADRASESKVKGKPGRTPRPSTGVPMQSQPSAPVNGPGPGLLNDFEVGESAGEIQLNSSKRDSGLYSNSSGGRQAAAPSGSADDDIAIDRIAKFEADNAKDALNRETAKESAKKRKLAILGKKTDLQASVPSGFAEIDASANGFSTFSLHVSDVSFKLAQAALNKGEWPDASRIRSEEFLNAFDYGDPMPTQNERVSCRVEQSIHPFLQQRNLLRVAMRTAAAGRSSSTPLKLTFLLDNSGSMERADRQQTVRRAFAVLAQQLKPIDEVTLISFARQPRLLADRISGAAAGSLVQTIENLPSEGGTNLEAALGLAFEKAQEQYQEAAQNRIILLTDGAVNLGDASPKRLAEMIVRMRNKGIAFDAAGISADGLNDEILEALTRKGDGRYYLLDSLESVEDGFAKQIAGALRPAAKNVKIQVEFNPERVGKYKLLGFEKHRLKKEDFRNDKVDAAEMAAAEAGVALYQVQTKPDGYGDIGTVSIRFRDLDSGNMVEELWPIPYETEALRPDLASNSMKIATVASLFAIKLKGDVLADTVDLKELTSLISSLAPEVRNDPRIKKLEVMIQQARQISGE